MRKDNFKLYSYLFLIYLIAICLFYSAAKVNTFTSINIDGIIIFSLLAIISDSLPVEYKNILVSTTFAIAIAVVSIFNTFWSMVIISMGVLFRMYKSDGKINHLFNIPPYKLLFNVSNYAISTYFTSISTLYISNFFKNNLHLTEGLQFLVSIIVFLFVNSSIISILIMILTNDNFLLILKSHINFGFLNIVSMAPLGYLLAYLYKTNNLIGIIVVMILVLFARYSFILYIESKSKYMQTVEALMHALESRDKYTEGHSRNVAKYVELIARELKFSESKIEELILASYLHDIGKIGISDSILNKQGKLTDEEYNIIKTHPVIGYNIVTDIKDLGNIPEIVRHHHEKYDGTGYPDKKGGDELSLDVYILQLADAVDAMATNRIYREALTWDEIHSELIKNRGTQFHPLIVDTFLKVCEKNNPCLERG
ncbi:Cyclic di-GMP phosphodiesterase response regulator RpfG [Caloramator mitchellensis]|uniref:Cyclic di-GMP phosphodiesterase response regulator RpfG n=1 Tax=Caloramator mitchellensis TaxID=908809 RepID=A0A0R3JW47_CALMK|nr:HD-GYP domain-containing protein [Caloramator mitchellensis]KRQ87787.1 Cyclic di-GMP phosphodiesterase response regulator RpfG [Caloramator mitchellensis]